MNYIDRLASNTTAIFLFHGVILENNYKIRNYNRKHVEVSYFEDLIFKLCQHGNPISLDLFLRSQKDTSIKLPTHSFVITFDDGFENNYSVAAPILEKYEVPAIFYITTGLVDKNLMTWVDKMEFCLEKSKEIEIGLPWDERIIKLNSPEEKIQFMEDVRSFVKYNRNAPIEKLLQNVYDSCQRMPILNSSDPLDLKMSWNQVKQLHSSPLFTIGGHSHKHPILSFLERDELENEILHSLNLIHECIGTRPIHYAYPEGLQHCYNQEVINCLKNNSIECCPNAIDGVANQRDDPFHLPRIMVV